MMLAEKSLRNVIRCFGVDDELIKINLYGDNVTYELKDNVRYVAATKKYADFNDVDRFYTTVYQHTSSAITSSRSYIASPPNNVFHGNTYQVETIFPKKFEKDSPLFFDTPFTASSIFGAHTADCLEAVDKTWDSPDIGNFQVSAIRPQVESKDVYFMLSSSNGGVIPTLTSSLFHNIYNNDKWNLNVRIKPKTYPFVNGVSGSTGNTFIVEFNGYNTVMDLIANSFSLTSSISSANGENFMLAPKRFYVGAHRTNFTGTVLQLTDVKISSLKVWLKYLDEDTIIAHSKDAHNSGVKNPYRNSWMTEISRSFGI